MDIKLLTLKIIAIFTVILMTSSCASLGERFRIDTDKPVDDFYVDCTNHYTSGLFSMGASTFSSGGRTFMTDSDEESSCGILLSAYSSTAEVSHPIYKETISTKEAAVNHTITGANIKEFVTWKERNKQALKLYESGYWDYLRDPLRQLLLSISRCYISKEYLKHYNEEKIPDYQELKSKYYNDILECNRENERIHHKYGKSAYSKYYYRKNKYNSMLQRCESENCKEKGEYLPERTLLSRNSYMWGRKIWDPYLKGSNKEKDMLTGNAYEDFLVLFENPKYYEDKENKKERWNKGWDSIQDKGQHRWFFINSKKRQNIESLSSYIVFDDEPTWLPTYKKKNFVKDCDGTILHLNWSEFGDFRRELYKQLYMERNLSQIIYCKNK